MTPKEKAIELVEKYLDANHTIEDWKTDINIDFELAKQCALIAVDEILENVDYFFKELENDNLPNKFDDEIEYWNEVKQEINNL